MIVGAVCLSHSPLLDKARADGSVERDFNAAVARLSAQVAAWQPDVAVVFYPDHFNGFFYDLMPAFCIGVRAASIGDYGTIPGALDVPEGLALDCARSCAGAGIDLAVSYRMSVDHGGVQPIELLSADHPLSRIIPVFVNCAAPPLPTFARVRALGTAVGQWAAGVDCRVLLVASGGLSHDPPTPSIIGAPSDVQAMLIDNRGQEHSKRLARQSRVFDARSSFMRGGGPLRPLNPDWDQAFLKSMADGELEVGDGWSEEAVTSAGGRGGHEVRTWVAALAAARSRGAYRAETAFYHPIKEWLTGTALLSAEVA